MQKPFRKLKWRTPESERNKVAQNPGTFRPVNMQAVRLSFPAPWWAKLNDPEFVGRTIAELMSELDSAKKLNAELKKSLNEINVRFERMKKLHDELAGKMSGAMITTKHLEETQGGAHIPMVKSVRSIFELGKELGYDLYAVTPHFQISSATKLPPRIQAALLKANKLDTAR